MEVGDVVSGQAAPASAPTLTPSDVNGANLEAQGGYADVPPFAQSAGGAPQLVTNGGGLGGTGIAGAPPHSVAITGSPYSVLPRIEANGGQMSGSPESYDRTMPTPSAMHVECVNL